jgi:phage terminase small subunit
MSRTKDHHWPEEGRTPRPPSPLKKAIKAAWRAFWRELKQQQRVKRMADPFGETK